MKTEKNTTTENTTTTHDGAFIEAARGLATMRDCIRAEVANIAKAMKVKKTAEEKELKPLRAHLRALLLAADYAENTAADYASELVREFTGKEKSAPRKSRVPKEAKAIADEVIASLKEKHGEADKAVLIAALTAAIKAIRNAK